jgi:hypothetical protein
MRRSGFALVSRLAHPAHRSHFGARFVASSGRPASGESSTHPAHHYQHHLRQSKDQNLRKKIPPPSPAAGDLYDAVMYDGAASRSKEISENSSLEPMSEDEAQFQQRLDELTSAGDPAGCISLLDEMIEAGVAPSPFLFTRAMRSCIPAGDADSAGELLERLGRCSDGVEKKRALERSRPIMGLVNASKRRPKEVIRVMGWSEEAAQRDIEELVQAMDLRRDAVAWGLVAWALNKLGKPQETMRLLDAVTLYLGLPLNDSLAHLAIEALGSLGRFEEANDVFATLLARRVVPHERTIGSLLNVLTSHGFATRSGRRRAPPDPDYIRDLGSLVSEPSDRFVSTCLRAYASCNLVEEAEQAFEKLCEFREGRLPDERACMTLMHLYGKVLIRDAPESVREQDVSAWYQALADKTDTLWTRYFDAYGDVPPTYMEAHARLKIFSRYILAKAVAGDLRGVLNMITEALGDEAIAERPWFEPDVEHFEALLFGVERSRDVASLYATLRAMADAKIEINDSCLASAVLVLVGNGEAIRAGKLVCVHADNVLAEEIFDHVQLYRRKRLQRRIEHLTDALHEMIAAAGKDDGGSASAEVANLLANLAGIADSISRSAKAIDT